MRNPLPKVAPTDVSMILLRDQAESLRGIETAIVELIALVKQSMEEDRKYVSGPGSMGREST